MTDVQRAFWTDLLAMGGRSRFPGRICAGESGGVYIGYPLNKFQSLMSEPIDVEQTLALFVRTEKILLTVTCEEPKLVMIELLNWNKYQSEYQRQKPYRDAKLQQGDQQSYNQSNKTEVEVEVEVEVEENQKKPSCPKPTARTFLDDSAEMKAARYLFRKIQENNVAAKPPEWQGWARQFDMIFRIDKRSPEEVRRIIDWSQSDSFWLTNILSPGKLRKQFDRLVMVAHPPKPKFDPMKTVV